LTESFLPGKVGLAPMAGITDYPFRKICFEYGASFAFTEMLSAKSVLLNLKINEKYFPRTDERRKTGIQLFGSDPIELAEAARIVEGKALWIDLNAGCPATKVVKRSAGSALLRDLNHLKLVVREMRKTTHKLSVKTRIGWEKNEFERIYNILVGEGVDAIFVHGRTAKQMYAGKPIWDVYNNGDVPIYLSGDIYTPEDVKTATEVSGADGVVVARGSIGNPWIFLISNDDRFDAGFVTLAEKLKTILRHLDYLEEEYGDHGALVFRGFIAGYTKNLTRAREFRVHAMTLKCIDELKKAFVDYFANIESEQSEVAYDGKNIFG